MTAFENRRVSTYAACAFICPYQPSSHDEKLFTDALEEILVSPPGDYLPVYRRLFFEAHTLAVQDLRSRLESRDGQDPRENLQCQRGWKD